MLEEQGAGRRQPRSARRWLTAAAAIALLAAMAIYAARTQEELASIRRLSLRVLMATCALQFASHIVLNASFLLPLRRSLQALGFWELYLVRTGGLVAGWFIPVAGGLAVRLAYLKNRGLTYVDFTWATLFSNLLALGAAAVLAAGATIVLWMMAGPLPASVVIVSAGVLLGSVAALAAFEFLPRLTRHPRLEKWRWLSDIGTLQANPRMAIWVFGLSLGRHVLNFVSFGLLYRSLTGGPADFLIGGLVYALTSPVRIVTITPGNLGVAEWFVALVGKMLAFDLITGLIVALAFRGVGLVAQGLGALLGSVWLSLRKAPS